MICCLSTLHPPENSNRLPWNIPKRPYKTINLWRKPFKQKLYFGVFWGISGVIKLPIFEGIQQCKWMVVCTDLPWKVHWLGWQYNDPCMFQVSVGFFIFKMHRISRNWPDINDLSISDFWELDGRVGWGCWASHSIHGIGIYTFIYHEKSTIHVG